MKYKANITITYETDEFEASDMEEARHIAYNKTNDWFAKKKLGFTLTTPNNGVGFNGDIGISEIEE